VINGPTSANQSAFDHYVVPETPVFYRVTLSRAGQNADAEDLVQDTLIRAYRAVDRFDGAHPRAWLLTILRHTHLNRVRVRSAVLLADGDGVADTMDRLGTATPAAEEVVVSELFESVVAEALAALAEKHRLVIQLVDIEGLSLSGAGRHVGCPSWHRHEQAAPGVHTDSRQAHSGGACAPQEGYVMFKLTRSECHQVAKVLQSYLDGETEAPTSHMVAEHLEVCRKCGLEASTYLAIKTAIAANAPEETSVDDDAVARLRDFADGLSGSQG